MHPTKSLAGNICHPQSRTTEQVGTNASTEDTAQARVMTDRELLISLVDRNHDWTKHQISEILTYMAQMHTSQKKTHQYAHHTYQRFDAILEAVITPEEIQQIGLYEPPLS